MLLNICYSNNMVTTEMDIKASKYIASMPALQHAAPPNPSPGKINSACLPFYKYLSPVFIWSALRVSSLLAYKCYVYM